MSDKLEQSKKGGPHALLASMAGDWQGVCKTWFDPGKLGDESPIAGSTRLALDGMFLLHEYEGTLQGAPMKGLAIIAYSFGEQQWQVAWIDSIHNGTRIMHSKSPTPFPPERTGSEVPTVLGTYPAGDGSPDWGWRTTLEMRTPDNLVITHYNITPEGEESPGVEIDYKRK